MINGLDGDAAGDASEIINLVAGTNCFFPDYEDATTAPENNEVGQISTFAFDRLLTCAGGLPDNTFQLRQCMYYDCIGT